MRKHLQRHGVRLAIVLSLTGFIAGKVAAAPRARVLLDAGWRFRLGDPADVTTNVTWYPEIADLAKLESGQITGTNSETYLETIRIDPMATHAGENVSFVQTNYLDSSWRSLDLPHDWVVELPFDQNGDGSHGFKPVGNSRFTTNNVGWYRRTFALPSGYAGQTLWLDFDGVYRNSLVWLNGHILGRNVSGYASFSYDITPYANIGGTNVLVVRADANRFEGWFYEGAGIYRHVWLTALNPVHVGHWGTYVTTSCSGSDATVTVQTGVTNQSGVATVNASLTSTVLNAGGNAVALATTSLNLAPGQGVVLTQSLALTNASLWSPESPYLYTLVSTVTNQGVAADSYTTPFGARTVSFDSTNGFSLNGRRVEIRGVCNHQDHAGVGSALPDRLQYFRLERLKQMGVNAYRTSHNMPTAELLEACDRLGFLVLDENRRIGTNAEPLSELARLLQRDRNHPSIIAWSLGNEEYYLQASSTAADLMTVMQNLAHAQDPTRLCTMPINGTYGLGFGAVEDIQGFNYALSSIDPFHQSHPTARILGTEDASTLTTRGIYTNDATRCYMSSYDTNGTDFAETWYPFYHARPWASGGFIWTGFDYRGEPTPYWWPCINSHFGILDTCGFPKDLFYYYQANWTLKPVLHLLPHWNWSVPGQPIDVWVFGNCDLVELFLNGGSQGQQALNVLGHAAWNVPYAAGTLQAVGYRNGRAVATNTVTTTGVPAAVALLPDRDTILADGRDLAVVTVAVLDAAGRIVPTATNLVSFSLSGGALIGVGDGDPSSREADKANQRSVFNGLGQVILQSTNQPGSMILSASSPGLKTATVTIVEAASLSPPEAPTGLVAVADTQRVNLSWDAAPGAWSYNLKRAGAGGGPYTVMAANTGAIGFTDAAVTNGATYYYVVSAANADGESLASLEVSATPSPPPAPTVPAGLSAVRGDTQVTLTWGPASGAASYNVRCSTSPGGPYAWATNAPTNGVVVAGLANNTPYYFVVSALNVAGESANSSEVSATPVAYVSGVTAIAVNSTIQLAWNAHPGATGYNVKRGSSAGGPYTAIANNLTGLNFTDSAVSRCQTYYYVVTLLTGLSESASSAEASATVPGLLPMQMASVDIGSPSPAGSGAYCGGQYTISGAGGDIWNSSDSFQFVNTYVAAATNCDLRARVVSVQNTSGNAKAGLMIRETLDANSRHAMVDVEPTSGLEFIWRTTAGASAASSGTGGGAPQWVRLTRANSLFQAYVSSDGNAWTQLGSAVTIPMSTGAYVGLVVCSHNNGTLNTSLLDNVAIGLPTVTGLTAAAVNGQVQLAWNAGSVGSYNVKRSTISGGPYTLIAAGLAATAFVDANAQVCQPYYYVVTMAGSGGESLPSTEVSAELTAALPPQFQTADIGSVGLAGNAGLCGGQYVVTGSGGDIWGNADGFRFAYASLNGDGQITARVVGVRNTDGWAKAGVMIRETLGADSRHAFALVSAGSGSALQYRTNTAGASLNSSGPTVTAPYWVRLRRAGNWFSAFTSPDGDTWTQMGPSVNIQMVGNVFGGLAVTAHNNALLNTSGFDSLAATFITNVPPSVGWVTPTNNTSCIQPLTLTLSATAADVDGTVTNLAFFDGTMLLGNASSGSGGVYSLIWTNPPPGNHWLTARATDNSGGTNTTPATVAIQVQPLTLTISGFQPRGQFSLTFQGQPGQNYVLETSTDLENWIPVSTSTPAHGGILFVNSNAVEERRFYRARE